MEKKQYEKPQLTTVRVELGVFGSYGGGGGGRDDDRRPGGRRGGHHHGGGWCGPLGWPFGD